VPAEQDDGTGVGFMLSSDKQIEHLEKLKAYADDYANFEAEQQAMLWQQQADYENNRLALIEKSEADIVRLKERSAGSQQKIAKGLALPCLVCSVQTMRQSLLPLRALTRQWRSYQGTQQQPKRLPRCPILLTLQWPRR
jgi:hypothetical protein